ncbi:hypothetical protein ACHQM5_017925 [Ranunculus cassubicifolius]
MPEVIQVITSKGCSRLFSGFSLQSMESFPTPFSPCSSSYSAQSRSGPFNDLVICVTGLSKEARKQVRDATERLGGQYSPNLHPQCTHLVVQSFSGPKFEHALKHGVKNGLFVVTLGWFVDSVRKNVKLSESLYNVKYLGDDGPRVELNRLLRVVGSEKSCVPAGLHENTKKSSTTQLAHPQLAEKESNTSSDLVLSGHSIYVDPNISEDVQKKVIDAAFKGGLAIINRWSVGCRATYVVCEGPSVGRYLGHSDNIVTPQWILKTTKENHTQRLAQLSTDLARQVSGVLENFQSSASRQGSLEHISCKETLEERKHLADLAKTGVRSRRRHNMQARQSQIRPITPSTLMDSVCWSISDPVSAAGVYTDVSRFEDHTENASFENLSRPLKESEKSEKIFKNHFLTILFPIDRFGEMGPSSRTFFSHDGFTCLQLLDYIYQFYQENMSLDEVSVAIHTDSKHADRLRSVYVSKETVESGTIEFKRIDFVGTRRSFEMLKRVSGDSSSNVYELLIRA